MKAGLIGTGTIGRGVAAGIARNGHSITVSRRNATHAAWLEKTYARVTTADNQAVIDNADIIFIALTTDVARDVIPRLDFRADKVVVSLMAEVSMEALSGWVHPGRMAAIMIPFPQIAAGGSPVMVLGDTAPVEHFFAASETIIALDSVEELDVFLCAQAVLSPAAVLVAQAAKWVEVQAQGQGTGQGDARGGAGQGAKAEVFLRALIASSLSGMASDDLIEALNTPGGYNQRLRQFFEARGFAALIKDGLDGLKDGG